MKILNYDILTTSQKNSLTKRAVQNDKSKERQVKRIIKNVMENGDEALLAYGKKFYGKSYDSVKVSEVEIRAAYKSVSECFVRNLKLAYNNIYAVHSAQLKTRREGKTSPQQGVSVWREWRAIEKVGLYVPGGKATYPSSVLMTAIPAEIAGCNEIIICTPPKADGEIPAATLVAADICGIKKIYKCGGAEAIAAMAYGTETVPKVYKIFGAGNSYVTLAKTYVFPEVAIDMPAGPSEVMIIADKTANPTYIAADLLADAEHGEDSACVLVTDSKKIAIETIDQLQNQLATLPTRNRAEKSLDRYGFILLVNSISDAIKFANDYAPEHLELMMARPDRWVDKVINAGSIFIGPFTAKAAGDYATGANHVLPTAGSVKMFQALSIEAFGRWMQVQECSRKGLSEIFPTIKTIADMEDLPAHRNSAEVRFK